MLIKRYFDHIDSSREGNTVHGHRTNHSVDDYPRELDNKMFLLKHFQDYMMRRLYHEDDEYTYIDKNLTHGMIFVQRYLRMKHVMLFRLSNDVLQVSFSTSLTDV